MDKKHKVCFKCSECDIFKTNDEQQFFKHLTSKHKPQLGCWCVDCKFCFDDPRDLISHVKNRACKPANITYPCGAANCKYTTKIGKELVQHVKSFHRGTTFTICVKCKKFYTVPHLLVLHIQNDCNSNLGNKSSRDTVKESVDNYESKQRAGRENESRSSRRGGRKTSSYLGTGHDRNSIEFKCDYCSFTGEKAALELHVSVHSNQGKRVKWESDPRFVNPNDSNEEKIKSQNLNKFQSNKPCPLRYKMQDERKKPCPLRYKGQNCTTKSYSAQQMRNKKACFSQIDTMRRTRSSALKYQCGYCLKKAPSLEEIKNHHIVVHDEEIKLRCFFFADDNDKAEDDVLYKCSLCDKGPDLLQKIKHHWQDLHGHKNYRLKICLNSAGSPVDDVDSSGENNESEGEFGYVQRNIHKASSPSDSDDPDDPSPVPRRGSDKFSGASPELSKYKKDDVDSSEGNNESESELGYVHRNIHKSSSPSQSNDPDDPSPVSRCDSDKLEESVDPGSSSDDEKIYASLQKV